MTIFQFWTVLAFLTTCIIVTYRNSKKMVAVLRQRDELAGALSTLVVMVEVSAPTISTVSANKILNKMFSPGRSVVNRNQ